MSIFTEQDIYRYSRFIKDTIGNYNKHYRKETHKFGYYGCISISIYEKRMFHRETLIKYIEFRPIADNEYVAFTSTDESLDRKDIQNYLYNVLPYIIH